MTWWQSLAGMVARDAHHFIFASIPAERTNGGQGSQAVVPSRDYFRVWLTEMSLSRDRAWFSSWHPAVHSLVRLEYGGQTVEVPRVAGGLDLQGAATSNLSAVIQLNWPLTGLMPFNGGVVEVMAGLLAMQGESSLGTMIKVLGDLSHMLMVPQLSTVLSLATPIANGLMRLVGATNGRLELGFHQAYAAEGGGSNTLNAGYFAVVLAERRTLDPEILWVVDDSLRHGPNFASAVPLQGHAYMLFRIERRNRRDGYASLTSIEKPFLKALEALRDGHARRAESYYRSAVVAVLSSPDITTADHRRVAEAIRKRFDEARDLGLGAVTEGRTLDDWIELGVSPDEAVESGEPSIEELLA
jgi:hypothetical protein